MRWAVAGFSILLTATLSVACDDDDDDRPPPLGGQGGSGLAVPPTTPIVGKDCSVDGVDYVHGELFKSEDECELCRCEDREISCVPLECDGSCEPEDCPVPDSGYEACCFAEDQCGLVADWGEGEICVPSEPGAGPDPYCPLPDDSVNLVGCCASSGRCGASVPVLDTGCIDPEDIGEPAGATCCSVCVVKSCSSAIADCVAGDECIAQVNCLYAGGCLGLADAELETCAEKCDVSHESASAVLECAKANCSESCVTQSWYSP